MDTTPRVRVAVFTDNDFAKVNGVTTTLRALVRHAPPGLEPHIYTHADHDADEPGYTALRSVGVGIPFYREMKVYLPRVGALERRTASDRIEVIHLTTPGPVGLAALRVAGRLSIPLVGSFHTDLGSYARLLSGSRYLEGFMRRFMYHAYARCERVFVPSDATREMLVNDRFDPLKIDIWTRGVDTETFSPSRRSDELRHAWGVGDDELALVYVGRVSKEKGLSMLPTLQLALQMRGVRHRWVIVGDGPFRATLQQLLPDAIFMGTVDHDRVAVPLASCDLFVFPSCTDTAGNVVLEAQACGLPVVVSDHGGPSENMVAGSSGLVCRGGDPAAFVGAIHELARCQFTRARMSEGARAYAETRTWTQALAPLYRAYARVGAARRVGMAADMRRLPASGN